MSLDTRGNFAGGAVIFTTLLPHSPAPPPPLSTPPPSNHTTLREACAPLLWGVSDYDDAGESSSWERININLFMYTCV